LLDGSFLPCAQITPRQEPILRFGINDPRLDGIDLSVKTIAAVDERPVFVGHAVARERLAGSAPASVVLQSTADMIGLLDVQTDLVKLPDGDGVDEVPGAPVVVAPVNATVAAGDDVVR